MAQVISSAQAESKTIARQRANAETEARKKAEEETQQVREAQEFAKAKAAFYQTFGDTALREQFINRESEKEGLGILPPSLRERMVIMSWQQQQAV